MTIKTPLIDKRSYDDLVAQTEELAAAYSGWQPPEGGRTDAGQALIRIFARMAEHVIERLNRAPDKNFLAFLDMIGARLQPARPARVPLTFTLAAGATQPAFVPAGTQVAAAAGDAQGDIVFETDQDLVAVPAQLTAVFVHDPGCDSYGNYTARAAGEQESFDPFSGDTAVEHSLYLACDDVFTVPGPKTITLIITSENAGKLKELSKVWEYVDGKDPWKAYDPQPKESVDAKIWTVTLENPVVPALRVVDDKPAAWLRMRLMGTVPAEKLQIELIKVKMERKGLTPDLAFANAAPLDLTKDFYPFGEQPRLGDTLYLASREAFSKALSNLTVAVKQSANPPAPVNPSPDLSLQWEAWDGNVWQSLWTEHPDSFISSDKRNITMPPNVAERAVNGELSYWIRTRIVAGDYGKPASLSVDENGKCIVEPSTLRPPVLESLKLDYTYEQSTVSSPGVICKTRNDFVFYTPPAGSSFAPFTSILEAEEELCPTLYLGFDRPFPNQATTLYLGVEPVFGATPRVTKRPAQLAWEYACTGGGWKPLGVLEDETRGMRRRGLITFLGPHDPETRPLFDLEGYWVRVRWSDGEFAALPKISSIRTNTIWASQGMTIRNEILGSGNGEPDQVFHTAKAPVLEGMQVEVCEPEMPSAGDRGQIERAEGQDAIRADLPNGFWVRWHEVADFYASAPRSRHYVLDPVSGEVRFGDGEQGLAAPLGRNNVRVAHYRTGGGARGNRLAGVVTQLKTTIPYVDRVTNHEPAGGGVDQESLDNVKVRGPKLLRHRDRAVTVQDFEDLACEASPDVARARAFSSTAGSAGSGHGLAAVTLVIVPRLPGATPSSAAEQFQPSLDLIERVETYLRERCAPTVKLQVTGPSLVQVAVTAELAPRSPQVANTLVATATRALQRFLQPLTGGFDEQGWEFGRQPHRSDLYALLERIDGVDYVGSLTFSADPQDAAIKDRSLICSGDHHVRLVAGQKGV